MSSYARAHSEAGSENPRFKVNNILTLDLEMPNRTTMDYEGPSVEPTIQAALESAMNGDQEEVQLEVEYVNDV
jgi:hypothetical protein